jgi:bifunctional non-homologous end joining protein LigD
MEDCFYQRHAMQGMPEGVEAMAIRTRGEFLVVRNARGFLGLTQFGAIEFHPWDCRADRLDTPDRCTIDLDPDEALDWPTVASAAFLVRERLLGIGLTPFVRTTGGKGLHIVVPLAGTQTWTPIKLFLKALAKSLASDAPRLFTTSPSKAQRSGRVFIDMGRTSLGSSAAASYSLRARPTFPVAVPLAWAELEHLAARPEFNSKSAVNRVESGFVDPWEDFEKARAGVEAKARKAVGLEA